ncbi:hypothetical protein GCM10010129_83680 [Streptomyces fumigatiscleroticus]|nr:hypothetical protein GCM10010129_83680 [Streptomyces fumigatiscleroticus]
MQPPAVPITWALLDDEHCLVLELRHGNACDKTRAWLSKSIAEIRWGSGGKYRAPVRRHESSLGRFTCGEIWSRTGEDPPQLHRPV